MLVKVCMITAELGLLLARMVAWWQALRVLDNSLTMMSLVTAVLA
jgi:hypothetical protein